MKNLKETELKYLETTNKIRNKIDIIEKRYKKMKVFTFIFLFLLTILMCMSLLYLGFLGLSTHQTTILIVGCWFLLCLVLVLLFSSYRISVSDRILGLYSDIKYIERKMFKNER